MCYLQLISFDRAGISLTSSFWKREEREGKEENIQVLKSFRQALIDATQDLYERQPIVTYAAEDHFPLFSTWWHLCRLRWVQAFSKFHREILRKRKYMR